MPTSASLTLANRGFARQARRAVAAGFALALAGCNSSELGPSGPNVGAAPTPQVQAQPLAAAAVGDVLGTGPVRVGLILPLTQNGGPSVVGASLRNAAQLALEESGMGDITLMIVDDHGTVDGAAQAAEVELGAGAEIILGPLLAPEVREVGRLAKVAGRPVIAFSTDEGAASPGVYLLSFLIESCTDRIAEYAVSRGKKSFAVIAPESDYANVAVSEFQQAAARAGARIVTVARYAPGQPQNAVQDIAGVASQIDALFIPELADAVGAVAAALTASGLKTQILGTDFWSDPRVLRLPALQGAWFAAPETTGFASFAQRYKAKFALDPSRLASLAHDAVSLVAALARTQGAQRFSQSVLTSASGFNGIDGLFRFRADGANDRGLAVMQISAGAASVISPAPQKFPGA
jgi:hypothetical protein